MMSTFVAPVALRIASTFVLTSLAVLTFDCEVLYLQLLSSAAVQPSLEKLPIIVVQSDSFSAQPWTKRIGSCATAVAPAGASSATVASATASRVLRIVCPPLFVLHTCDRGP